MLRKTIYVVAVLAVSAGASFASAADGSPAYNFLNISPSTLVYGLGGVNISVVGGDANTTEQNPALLGPEMDNELELNYMRYVGESNFAGVRYARAAGERGAWSAAVQYFGYGSIQETLPDGTAVGVFSPVDVAFSGAYSHDFNDRLRGGIDLKFLYSSYADFTALALATDLGINYYDEDHDLSLSAVAANLGGQIKRFDQSFDRLPIDVRLGASKTFGAMRVSLTAWNLTKWDLPYYKQTSDDMGGTTYVVDSSFASNLFRHLVVGVDYVGSDNFYVGLGYNYKTRTDMAVYKRSILSGFSLAAGLNVKSFGLGLAFAQPHSGATTLMVNLSCNLNTLLNR